MELNSPIIVTSEMAEVIEGTMLGGSIAFLLNQEVLESELSRRRRGRGEVEC